MSALGQKQTSAERIEISAKGQKQTFEDVNGAVEVDWRQTQSSLNDLFKNVLTAVVTASVATGS